MAVTQRRAVIFGGSGFIGGHVAKSLVSDGWDVHIGDICSPHYTQDYAAVGHLTYHACDVRVPIELSIEQVDWIINLAAVHRTPGHRDNEYYDTNVGGALNVTEWATRTGTHDVTFTSTIAVYGRSLGEYAEKSPAEPDSSYGRSKLLAERVHLEWACHDRDRSVAIIRPAVIFGPGENGNFTRLARALSRGVFVIPGDPSNIKACGYVYDLVEAARYLYEKRLDGLFNFCYPEDYSIGEICDRLSAAAGCRTGYRIPTALQPIARSLVRTPMLPVSRNARQRAQKLMASTRVRPERLVESGFKWKTNLDEALNHWLAQDPIGVSR